MRINVSRGQFSTAIEKYRAEGRLDEAGAASLEWMWGYLFAELKGDLDRLAEQLDYHHTNIYKVCMGTYEAGLDKFLAAVLALRRRAAAEITTLVETCLTRRIFQALDYAKEYRALVAIRGETGRGKSKTAEEWTRRNNHGLSALIRINSDCNRTKIVRATAVALGIGVSGKTKAELEEAIFAAIPKDKVIIFDEAGNATPTAARKSPAAIEFIRDIIDNCQCGAALIITDVYWDNLRRGPHAPFLEQFRGRIKYHLAIPQGRIFRDEIVAICRAYAGTEPDDAMITAAAAIAHGDGKIRTLCDDLAKARNHANKTNIPLTAEVLAAARKWRDDGGVWTDETV